MERVGRYRITGKLGEGGMGVVSAARDERLDRPVAIRMIREAAATPESRERFWREARAAASVNHPNVCQLYEIGEENGELFLAMELLEGESLARRLQASLELNPELAVAHNLYAQLEVALGRARDAMVRLLQRAQNGRTDPELFAGLCPACRYCGLLEASVAAHDRARRLDPKILTGVAHTYFALGAYERVLESDPAQTPYISVLSLAAIGRQSEARSTIDRLTEKAVPRMRDILAAAGSLLDDRPAESVAALDRVVADFKDPEGLFYFGRHYAHLREARRALDTLASAVDGGLTVAPVA
jgi:tetratricopeptide (TPR) repeat protein